MTPQSLVRNFLGAIVLAAALTASLHAQRLPTKIFTSADGLGSSFVDHLMRDSRGFLWFCTRDGLSRFDGSRFVTYQVGQRDSAPGVEYISETSGGVYWVTTTGGLYRFRADVVAQPQTNGRTDRTVLPAEYIGNDRGSVFEDRQGRLWWASGGLNQLVEVDGKVTTRTVPLNLPQGEAGLSITDLQQGADDSLWMNSTAGVVRRLPDGRIVLYEMLNRVGRGNRSMMLDAEGRIWFATGSSLLVLKPETIESLAGAGPVTVRSTARFPTADARAGVDLLLPSEPGQGLDLTGADFLKLHALRKLYQTADRHIWLTTAMELVEYDGRAFHRFTTSQGLLPSMARLAEDAAGNLWIGGQTGLVRLARHSLRTYTDADGLNSLNVQAIREAPDGTLFFANGEFYLSELNGTGFRTARPGLPESALPLWSSRYALLDRKDNWWILTSDKLYRFARSNLQQPAAVYSVDDGLKANEIFQIYEDQAGNIWVSQEPRDATAERALSVLRIGATKFYSFGAAEGYPDGKSASSFAEDRLGRLWVGFYQGGLARYADGRFTYWGSKDGVPKGVITDLHVDAAGRLWLTSSNGGVGRVADLESNALRFENFTTNAGLSSDNVRTVTEDRSGNIYVGTVRGVDQLSGEGRVLKHFSVSDGLAGDFVVDSHCDRNGAVWFATTSGLSRLIPAAAETRSPPAVWLGALRVGGLAQPVAELGQATIAPLELHYTQNTLQVDFFGLDFRAGDVLRYQYKLEGAGSEWSAPSEQRTVTLANLQPGNYRFLVRAINSDGTVSTIPAEVRFRIAPPFWLRWWFIALCGLVVIGAIVGVYSYRTARLRQLNATRAERIAELERVRNRIATDLHDDIGASLTQIAVLSEVAQAESNSGNGASAKPLKMISNVSNELVETMSDIVWSINPNKDHLSDLTQRMRRVASDLLTAKGIAIKFNGPDRGLEIPLDTNLRREVFLIFKESINNVVKHSGAEQVQIEFGVSGTELKLEICDNGHGFTMDPAGVTAPESGDSKGGNGLLSMQKRAREIRGELVFDTRPGAGTKVSLRLPLEQNRPA